MNILSCRKCRKEFCWICMQDWSLHSDNTGGYFQCNRFIQNEDSGDNSSGWVDERGNAHAETMRLRERGRKMARFIHYFTRYKAHGDSAQMESKMKKETVQRITTSLHGSIEGKLRWLQGDIVKNPLEKIEFDHPQIKHAQSFKGSLSKVLRLFV